MRSWPPPSRPALPGTGRPVRLHDTATGRAAAPVTAGRAGLYVCGITPYDAAHLGHAATYVAFDLLVRSWLDAGLDVTYVQNVTDVDDPLLERAAQTGVDWQELAESQLDVYRDDMAALAVLPPDALVGVTEVVDEVGALVRRLEEAGAGYRVPQPDDPAAPADVYFDVGADVDFGAVSGLDRERMLALSAERGGDPDREGKKDPLDPLLWRGARPGEPSWHVDGLPPGRPGWHVECVAIATNRLAPVHVQGGGSDLVFPHHEMGASHAHALGIRPYAHSYAHAGMVGLHGEKMSKSKGNLEFVHRLVATGVPAAAVRLALLAHHYREDWTWEDADAGRAVARLDRWRAAVSHEGGPEADSTLAAVRDALADDLDAPAALRAVDAWCERQERGEGPVELGAPGLVARAADGLLGVRL
ncbi:cysteine--1-D-myo-inosityl 2-amino-2-deoxy-alpha-D-glucopyranoside ligase [Aquipuribacter nitratireducens]|uniref:L-cysteine:1D-myo-inositol 2-amino-2-deoxy-alpha-D-glucopyranoside ligase n=1 Tax=Aquipuribacter nitratireducens TaxID=650104 RepID=A0ABW0GJH8_9MICO